MTSHKKYIEGAAFIKIALDPRVAWAFLRRDTGFLQSDRAFGETVTTSLAVLSTTILPFSSLCLDFGIVICLFLIIFMAVLLQIPKK